MINPKSRSFEWITDAALRLGVRDIIWCEIQTIEQQL